MEKVFLNEDCLDYQEWEQSAQAPKIGQVGAETLPDHEGFMVGGEAISLWKDCGVA
jgi:hypothetical protein